MRKTMATKTRKTKPMTRMETFVIQLATVVTGIVITFGGSSLLTKYFERKEVHAILGIVREELEYNKLQLKRQKEYFLNERRHAKALKPYIDNPSAIPIDTLKEHGSILYNTTGHDFFTTAFEVMKNLPRIQSLENSKLLYEMIHLYAGLTSHQNMMDEFFYNVKSAGWEEIMAQHDVQVRKAYENRMESFVLRMTYSPHLRSYVDDVADQYQLTADLEGIDEIIGDIDEMIAKIDNEIQ